MTHLRIEQSETQIEYDVTAATLSYIVSIAKSGSLDSTSNLSGRLQMLHAYRSDVNYITANFPQLHITVTEGYYHDFGDTVVNAKLGIKFGDGTGVVEANVPSTWAVQSSDQNMFLDCGVHVLDLRGIYITNSTPFKLLQYSGDATLHKSVNDYGYTLEEVYIESSSTNCDVDITKDADGQSWTTRLYSSYGPYMLDKLYIHHTGSGYVSSFGASNGELIHVSHCCIDASSVNSDFIKGIRFTKLILPNTTTMLSVPQLEYFDPIPTTGDDRLALLRFSLQERTVNVKNNQDPWMITWPACTGIYVPDALVNTYKADAQWGKYASIIYSIDDYTEIYGEWWENS